MIKKVVCKLPEKVTVAISIMLLALFIFDVTIYSINNPIDQRTKNVNVNVEKLSEEMDG